MLLAIQLANQIAYNNQKPVGINHLQNQYPTVSLVDDKIHKRLYDLTAKFITLCQKSQIQYWAICGTALGALRHQSIIPWDDDVDMAIDDRDSLRFTQAIYKYATILHLDIQRPPASHFLFGVWRIGSSDGPILLKNNITADPRIDVHLMKPNLEHTAFVFARPILRACFSQTKIPIDLGQQHMKVQQAKFGPISIQVPRPIEPYLTQEFGPNWKTECRVAKPRKNTLPTRTLPYKSSTKSFILISNGKRQCDCNGSN